jgi:hypothetical protein
MPKHHGLSGLPITAAPLCQSPAVQDVTKSVPWVPNLRPVAEDERPFLKALGSELKRLHNASGGTWSQLAYDSLLSQSHLESIAWGRVRTRKSTLARFAAAVVEIRPDLGPVDELVEHLCGVAGPSLAAESEYQSRIDRKLARRAIARERGLWIP